MQAAPAVAPGPTPTLDPSLDPVLARLRDDGRFRRILFVAGTGDVEGTWRSWAAGRDDPSIPNIGYSQQVYELADRLGAALTVLTERPSGGSTGETCFLRLRCRTGPGPLHHLGEIAYALAVVRIAWCMKADAIVFQRTIRHFWPLALAPALGVPVVLSLHNGLWPGHRGPTARERLVGRLNGWLFRRAARRVISIGPGVDGQVRLVGGPRARADIQIPQYPAARDPGDAPPCAPDALRALLYVGRVEENKGVFMLLDVFERLGARHPAMTLTFAGGGGALEALRAAAAASSVAGRVRVLGQIPGREVFDELGRSDLLVCPTTTRFTEGMAKTPIEAALAGVPSVVSTAVPTWAVLGDAARVFRADDADHLAETLAALADDPATLRRMATATRAAARDFFDRRRSLASRIARALADIPPEHGPPETGRSVHDDG